MITCRAEAAEGEGPDNRIQVLRGHEHPDRVSRSQGPASADQGRLDPGPGSPPPLHLDPAAHGFRSTKGGDKQRPESTTERVTGGVQCQWEDTVCSSAYRKGDCMFWRVQRRVDFDFSALGQRSGCRHFSLL